MNAIALCAAVALGVDPSAPPEWLHLLPAGEIRTVDNRGPYRVADMSALIATSMAGGKLVLDESHSTDLAAPQGLPAPARGWIVQLEARQDGLWGRVEWTSEASRTQPWRAYRGVSPVIAHDKSNAVTALLRASLVNTPNLTGLTTLHAQDRTMDNLRAQLITMLDLQTSADDRMVLAKVAELVKRHTGKDVAMMSATKMVGKAKALQAAKARDGIVIGYSEAARMIADQEGLD
ncbi:phage protease [Sphingomonas bacterium]|uniref:phage protease n=1 Tax=Sphingomonas bacterium TaxID=1895847 RepID=UPI0015752E4C|nr:phage protease [Sphingomonas bacterium]